MIGAYRISVGKPEGKRPLGRPRHEHIWGSGGTAPCILNPGTRGS
jgi:hypothetical protein